MIAFNIKNLIKAINNCAFTQSEVNVKENKFLFSDIVEETLYVMSLVKMVHGNVMKKLPPVRGFNPVKGIHNQSQLDSYFNNGLGMNTWIIKEDFTQGPIQFIKSHGIFNLGVAKEAQTINLCKLDPSWVPVWRAFYTRRFKPEHVTLQNVNAYILVITENVRGLKFAVRAADRQQATANGVKNDEDQYWKMIDHMRIVICNKKSIDINDDEVFRVITDLVNGHLILYEANLGYPQINLLEPDSLPHNNIKQCMKWCLTHLQPKYFSLIAGTLKNISRNAGLKLVELKEGGVTRIGRGPFAMEIITPASTQTSVMFDFCSLVVHNNACGKTDKLHLFKALLFALVEMKEFIVEGAARGLPEDFQDTITPMHLLHYQTNPLAIVALASILITENGLLCDIRTIKDAHEADAMIELAITVLKEIGAKGGDLNNRVFDEWLSFYTLSPLDYTDEFFDEKVRFQYPYVPKKINDHWMEKDEYYKKCFERYLGTTIEECNRRIAAGDKSGHGKRPALQYNCFDEVNTQAKTLAEKQEQMEKLKQPQQQRGNGNGNSKGRGNQQRSNGNGNSRGRGTNGRGRGANGSRHVDLN